MEDFKGGNRQVDHGSTSVRYRANVILTGARINSVLQQGRADDPDPRKGIQVAAITKLHEWSVPNYSQQIEADRCGERYPPTSIWRLGPR
jgi:hypothetical protein